MKREKRRCKNCGRIFLVCPKVKKHEYCKRAKCQRERKNAAQKRRMAEDAQYRADQYIAQKDWCATHADYWNHVFFMKHCLSGARRPKPVLSTIRIWRGSGEQAETP